MSSSTAPSTTGFPTFGGNFDHKWGPAGFGGFGGSAGFGGFPSTFGGATGSLEGGRTFGGFPSTFGGFGGYPSTFGGFSGSFGGFGGLENNAAEGSRFGGFPAEFEGRFGGNYGYPGTFGGFGGFGGNWGFPGSFGGFGGSYGYPGNFGGFGGNWGYPGNFGGFGGNFGGLSNWGYPGNFGGFGGNFGGLNNWGYPGNFGGFGGNFGGNFGGFGGLSNTGFGGFGGRFGGENFSSVGFRPSSSIEYYTLTNPVRVLDREGNRCIWLCYELKGYKPEECNVTFDKKERAIIVEATHDVKEGKDHHVTRKFYRKFVFPETLSKVDLTTCELKSFFNGEGFLFVECTLPKLTSEELAKYPTGNWSRHGLLSSSNFGGFGYNAHPITVKTC